MGSLDNLLNLTPHHHPPPPPPQEPISTATSAPLLTPKLEPRTEPTADEIPTVSISNPTSAAARPPPPPPSSVAVYSSNGFADLFRSSFARRLQRYDDVSVLDSESGAIIPVPDENPLSAAAETPPDSGLSNFVQSRRPKPHQRSGELVRVTNLGIEDERNFQEVVKRTRMLYDSLRIYLTMEEDKRLGYGLGKRTRVDLKAATVMKESRLWLNRDKRIVGAIPGVEIGDIFFFRMELCVVGLHGQTQAGIDYLPASISSSREPIATSIIVSGGYEDDEDAGDEIIYTGHGGQDKFNRQAEHQKLEGGNLAMERSMCYGIEVRVIRGIKYENRITSKVYVYDGLFRIVDCWFDVGKSGFGVFKFKLVRIEGQPEMGSSVMKFAQTLRSNPWSARPRGYLSFDISNKKENVPVLLYNDIDNDHEPLCYEYLAKTVFPPPVFIQGNNGSAAGCNCVSRCNDNCLCAMKNGGDLAYDNFGNLLRGKPVIYECGPLCQCPPSCCNRVTQKGLRYRLEVFRSQETSWGVRSLDIIPAGAFICEYSGVALTREQAEILSMNGDTLVYPGRFTERWGEWGDLSQILPDQEHPSYPSLPPLDFAMDVSKMRNVACYISHSASPNVIVQFVMFDHNNVTFPHVMLFALENIPPLTELSLDYGMADEWTPKQLAICN